MKGKRLQATGSTPKAARGQAGSRTAVRRKDRAVDDPAWIRAFLLRAPFGYLASVADGQPFINANLFLYDEAAHAIYLHTARQGRTRHNLEQASRVCLTVAAMGRLLPADTALEFSVEYGSVVIFGTGAVVSDADEARRALQALLDKYAPHLRPGRDYRATTDQELARTSVYRVSIDEWSGKRKVVEDDFPGAFRFEPPLDWWADRSGATQPGNSKDAPAGASEPR